MMQESQTKTKSVTLTKFLVRYSKLITFFLVVIIIFSSYFFIIGPKYESVNLGGQYSLDTLTQERDQRQNYLADLKALVARYQQISQADIVRLEKTLPLKKDVASLFVQFQALAEKHQFRLLSVNIDDAIDRTAATTAAAGVQQLNVSLNLAGGSYVNLKEFLASIESNLRLFDINAVYFSPDSSSYSMNLFTYYLN